MKRPPAKLSHWSRWRWLRHRVRIRLVLLKLERQGKVRIDRFTPDGWFIDLPLDQCPYDHERSRDFA